MEAPVHAGPSLTSFTNNSAAIANAKLSYRPFVSLIESLLNNSTITTTGTLASQLIKLPGDIKFGSYPSTKHFARMYHNINRF